MLLAGAGTLLATLIALQSAHTGYNMRQVLAIDVPSATLTEARATEVDFMQQATQRMGELPGVVGVAAGSVVPWRDARTVLPRFQFAVEGYQLADGEENPHARIRFVAPRFFAVLGVPLVAGRDFNDDDRAAASRWRLSVRVSPNGSSRTATR